MVCGSLGPAVAPAARHPATGAGSGSHHPMSERNSWLGYWRDWRFWAVLWVSGSLALLAVLAWDARSWFAGSPQASFRQTYLATWPVETMWWFLAPLVLWLHSRLTLLDRRWPWALGLHVLTAF